MLDRAAGEQFLRTKSAIFPGLLLAQLFDITDGPLYEQMARNIINVNGADHSRLRSLVNPALSPRAAERYRPLMREILARPLARRRAERFDFVPRSPSPTRRGRSRASWARRGGRAAAARLVDVDPAPVRPDRAERRRAAGDHAAQGRGVLRLGAADDRARRREPGDDLISTLILAEEEGERLSDVELENLVLNVLVGGVDTTQSQLAHAIRLLAEHPEQWAALRRRPVELAPRAAEEALRYEPITPLTARMPSRRRGTTA